MAEYIDREKAKSMLHIEYAYAAEQLLDEIPAADVAPVMRCKDCDGAQVSDDGKYVVCCRLGISTEFWDFCSYGERKDGADAEG